MRTNRTSLIIALILYHVVSLKVIPNQHHQKALDFSEQLQQHGQGITQAQMTSIKQILDAALTSPHLTTASKTIHDKLEKQFGGRWVVSMLSDGNRWVQVANVQDQKWVGFTNYPSLKQEAVNIAIWKPRCFDHKTTVIPQVEQKPEIQTIIPSSNLTYGQGITKAQAQQFVDWINSNEDHYDDDWSFDVGYYQQMVETSWGGSWVSTILQQSTNYVIVTELNSDKYITVSNYGLHQYTFAVWKPLC